MATSADSTCLSFGFIKPSLASLSNLEETPSGASGKKKKVPQNIVPVAIYDILKSTDDIFKVEGMDVNMVIIIGSVMSIKSATTKNTIVVKDDSGNEIEVLQWLDENSQPNYSWSEGSLVKVIGHVRSSKGDQHDENKKHIMAIKIWVHPTKNEVNYHFLDIVHSRIKIKKLIDVKENPDKVSVSTHNFGNAKYDLVYNCIRRDGEESGISRDHLYDQVMTNMSKQEMETSIDFLSAEGNIYTTIDEDHFKCVEED